MMYVDESFAVGAIPCAEDEAANGARIAMMGDARLAGFCISLVRIDPYLPTRAFCVDVAGFQLVRKEPLARSRKRLSFATILAESRRSYLEFGRREERSKLWLKNNGPHTEVGAAVLKQGVETFALHCCTGLKHSLRRGQAAIAINCLKEPSSPVPSDLTGNR